jgi:hypothetical protein
MWKPHRKWRNQKHAIAVNKGTNNWYLQKHIGEISRDKCSYMVWQNGDIKQLTPKYVRVNWMEKAIKRKNTVFVDKQKQKQKVN